MKAAELYDLFRSDVVDFTKPYLWSDDEAWLYMADAYRTFVRLIGGVPDYSSDLTQIPIVAGEATAEVSPLILKFRTAYLLSTGRKLRIVNDLNEPIADRADYGSAFLGFRDDTPGPVVAVVTGMERNRTAGSVKWVRVPMENDTCQLGIYRLPTVTVSEATPDFEFDDIGEEHHIYLLDWMKARAYGKQDAETFDRSKRDEHKKAFNDYCTTVKFEWDRYRSTTQPVEYGGI